MSKQYYKVIRGGKIEFWHGESARAAEALSHWFFILPLGSKKPRNVSRETIKEF